MSTLNKGISPAGFVSRPDIDAPYVIVARGGNEYITTNSLVLNAIGIEHHVDVTAGQLLVHEDNSARAIQELHTFAEENKNWPPLPNYTRSRPRTDNPPTLLMMGGLVVFYMFTGPWSATNQWFQNGAINSQAILQGHEWWRLITALTLHANQVHLVGNCVIGGFMVHLLSTTTGYGTGWLAMLLTAALGNWLNIVLRGGPHDAVGFSTAVFAAIGIMCGQEMGRNRYTAMRQVLVALGAGIGLLAMLGSQGQQTDLGAHLFGLLCGIGGGLLVKCAGFDRHGNNSILQGSLFTITLLLLWGSWLLAENFQ